LSYSIFGEVCKPYEIADNINLLCGLTVYLNTLMDYDFFNKLMQNNGIQSEIERQIIINCGIQ